MTNRTAIHSRLHALIGDVAADVPEDLAREIECALNEDQASTTGSSFLERLNAIRQGDCADGRGWTGEALGSREMASISRSVNGLETILDVLHAASRTHSDGLPSEHIGDFYSDGLILAARQIVCALRIAVDRSRTMPT
ncbi:hypothetical protein N7367_03015 [Stenotrophomonas sp. GD04145]|uniref:hypothetical protein n=1 Tax=Stenotrophomonas sp. GD04145 TaxID=2975436 RepID=UPI002449D7E6|nr:hypothetical protein [Stenotrophomonas sp. GD04145]MDH0170427.1 hypothetical protein [Stenotrophomonas sp. GD04145]